MSNHSVRNVPRYFKPFVNDCLANSYGAVLTYLGQNPDIILADYLSFLYDPATEFIGVNYCFWSATSVMFSEDVLNTSYELLNIRPTVIFDQNIPVKPDHLPGDQVQVNIFVHDDPAVAYARTKQLIDHDIPVIAALDLYHMDYHRAFQKEHGLHCVIITGYNEAEDWFEMFDKYEISSSDFDGKQPVDKVKLARTAESVVSNPVTGKWRRMIRNLWMELNISPEFKITEDRLFNILRESCRRMLSRTKVLGHQCGLEALAAFRDDLIRKKENLLDERNLFYFKTYLNTNFKGIARNRMRFKAFLDAISHLLPGELVSGMAVGLDESSKNWNIIANLALKIGITKSPDLIDNMDRRLEAVREIETRMIHRLENFLTNTSYKI